MHIFLASIQDQSSINFIKDRLSKTQGLVLKLKIEKHKLAKLESLNLIKLKI